MKYSVIVVGANGKMGREIIKGLGQHEDITIVGAVDISNVNTDIGELVFGKSTGVRITADLFDTLEKVDKHCIVIDFTRKESAQKNIPVALKKGIPVVVGTTGFTEEELAELDALATENKTGILVAPNFSLGAVLMMKYAGELSKYYQQAEIIEYHNDKKVDSPSGTSIATAKGMCYKDQACRADSDSHDPARCRGGEFNGVRIHSVRLQSLIAHQEVMFSGVGELLTIRHDSYSRESFIPGILLAVKKAGSWQGLKFGLDQILD